MTQHCGRAQPHPTHKAMTGRHAYQCPGNPFVPTETQPEPAQPRHTVDSITSDQLDQLYDWLSTSRAAAQAEKQRAERAERVEAELAKSESKRKALMRAHVDLARQAGRDQAAIERVRRVLAERRAEIADYEAENEPAAWSDAAANTCSRIEDALRHFPEPQCIRPALDDPTDQTPA